MKQCKLSLAALGYALAFPALAGLPASIHTVEISSPRDYGLVMGEPFRVEIQLKTAAGLALETETLPRPGSAVSEFLDVREVYWSQQPLGDETLYRITVTYQVFKGVREAETLAVPALPLRFSGHGESVEALAPAWSFSLMPIIPAKTPDEAVVLRGELPPPDYDSTSHWRSLAACLAGLVGLGLVAVWKLGLFPFRRHPPPFLRAAYGLKKLGRQPATLAAYRQAAKLVHDALNETAGYVVFPPQLQRFLANHPEYQNFSLELEQFFSMSERLFFSTEGEPAAALALSSWESLCRKLAKAKR